MILGIDIHKMDVIFKNIDELYRDYSVDEISDAINKHLNEISDKSEKHCNSCICQTCSLAEVNGGAPGCGDCYACVTSSYPAYHCNSCKEYHYDKKANGATLSYFLHREEREREEKRIRNDT